MVVEDLRNGFISRASAREIYKVVVHDDFSVDMDGTSSLRGRSR
jgi:hypothetical protein